MTIPWKHHSFDLDKYTRPDRGSNTPDADCLRDGQHSAQHIIIHHHRIILPQTSHILYKPHRILCGDPLIAINRPTLLTAWSLLLPSEWCSVHHICIYNNPTFADPLSAPGPSEWSHHHFFSAQDIMCCLAEDTDVVCPLPVDDPLTPDNNNNNKHRVLCLDHARQLSSVSACQIVSSSSWRISR